MKVETAQDLAEGSPFVYEVALAIYRSGLFGFDEEPKAKIPAKIENKPRKPHRPVLGKVVSGASHNYWERFAGKALGIAMDDTTFPKASNRTRTYKLYKQFFQNEWKNKKFFTMEELKRDIIATYGEPDGRMLDAHGFLHGYRFQIIPWSNGVFYENGELATKPICRKLSRGIFLNIFHRDAKNCSRFENYEPTFTRS